MNNADMPAMPNEMDSQTVRFLINEGVTVDGLGRWQSGLTKREYIAAMAMQGLLASWGQHDVTDMRELASDATSMADALLAELERTGGSES